MIFSREKTIKLAMENSNNNDYLILQFVDKKVLDAFNVLTSEDSSMSLEDVAYTIAEVFYQGNAKAFVSDFVKEDNREAESKLIQSFHRNLKLLAEKTWVEAADISEKDRVLYEIDRLCEKLEQYDYVGCYKSFVNVMFEVVYLMFGSQAKKEDFAEYTLRIAPEFGIFWRYLQGLPKDGGASAEKSRISILLGMYFLSNY